MAKFVPGVDTKVEAPEPLLEVAVSAASPLKVGKHVFELVVTDDAGNESAPANVTIIIADTTRPTAVLDVIDSAGRRISTPAVNLAFGDRFALSGERSTDIGGTVKTWRWTLLAG